MPVPSLSSIKPVFRILILALIAIPVVYLLTLITRYFYEGNILRQVIDRLSADSCVAEVVVTKTELEENTGRILTTIKFLEYSAEGKPLEPKYFTFSGNIIQFQALVVRFDDKLVRAGNRAKGKSAYIFLKAFALDEKNTQIFPITDSYEIPRGYKIEGLDDAFEGELWKEFWDYALNPERRQNEGIKNAQIEAPGSLFLPGTLYTIRIEHDGGMRIDTQPIPAILRGEQVA